MVFLGQPPEFVYALIYKSLATGVTKVNQRRKSEERGSFPVVVDEEGMDGGCCLSGKHGP